MIRYAFFDLDGTLTDPGVGITSAVAHALKTRDIEVSDLTTLYPFIGPPLIDSFMKYYGVTEPEADELVAAYREYYNSVGLYQNEMYPGIPEMLNALIGAGIRPVVATSKPQGLAIRVLEHFDLAKYFTFIGGAGKDKNTRNTKAAVIHYCLEELGITDLSEVVMVGDREHDIIGAHTEHLPCIAVLYGYGNQKEFEEAGADIVVSTVEELTKTLLRP